MSEYVSQCGLQTNVCYYESSSTCENDLEEYYASVCADEYVSKSSDNYTGAQLLSGSLGVSGNSFENRNTQAVNDNYSELEKAIALSMLALIGGYVVLAVNHSIDKNLRSENPGLSTPYGTRLHGGYQAYFGASPFHAILLTAFNNAPQKKDDVKKPSEDKKATDDVVPKLPDVKFSAGSFVGRIYLRIESELERYDWFRELSKLDKEAIVLELSKKICDPKFILKHKLYDFSVIKKSVVYKHLSATVFVPAVAVYVDQPLDLSEFQREMLKRAEKFVVDQMMKQKLFASRSDAMSMLNDRDFLDKCAKTYTDSNKQITLGQYFKGVFKRVSERTVNKLKSEKARMQRAREKFKFDSKEFRKK